MTAIITCTILLVSELFIFNLPHWQTRDNQTHTITDITTGDGVTHTDEGYLITESAQSFIEFKDKSIEYIRINPTAEKPNSTFRFQLIAQHEGNTGWYTGQLTRYYNAAFPTTYYAHVGNKTSGVRLEFKQAENKTIPIDSIAVNPVIPFKISIPRIAIEFLLVAFSYFQTKIKNLSSESPKEDSQLKKQAILGTCRTHSHSICHCNSNRENGCREWCHERLD